MDFQSLVAAHMRDRRPPPMSASAEDRYYRDQVTLPRLKLRLLGLIGTTGGTILLLAGIALA
ncbi:hypothetical protein [Rhizobium sp. BK251]|uniref:hypothetical protein n=1 Tax=Rhizobium sp. BK251 TaxID=2512125 RepID=UPI001047DF21|nr:hypothetical protein [Rhizobium sp. BK251]